MKQSEFLMLTHLTTSGNISCSMVGNTISITQDIIPDKTIQSNANNKKVLLPYLIMKIPAKKTTTLKVKFDKMA